MNDRFHRTLDAALDVDALAELIWTTSRADESTISAAGANLVARAVLASDWFAARLAEARVEGARSVHGVVKDVLDDTEWSGWEGKETFCDRLLWLTGRVGRTDRTGASSTDAPNLLIQLQAAVDRARGDRRSGAADV